MPSVLGYLGPPAVNHVKPLSVSHDQLWVDSARKHAGAPGFFDINDQLKQLIDTGDLDPNASCPPGIEPSRVSIIETRLPPISAPENSAPTASAPRAPQMGTFCHTQAGRFGPGLAQPLGSSCVANAPSGQLAGQIGR
jgi:hypothetical protein